MDEEASTVRQQFMENNDCLIKPLEIRVNPAPLGVPVGLLLDKARLLGESDGIVIPIVETGNGGVEEKSAPVSNGGSM
jgi:hypothetical protein